MKARKERKKRKEIDYKFREDRDRCRGLVATHQKEKGRCMKLRVTFSSCQALSACVSTAPYLLLA
jgi:hypothetical protein